jgi:adenylosuccinate lyase
MFYPLSPLDGRYAEKVAELSMIFSEYGLMKYRTMVEIHWLFFLSENKIAPSLDPETVSGLKKLLEGFDQACFQSIKKEEATTNHDVKAVEYFLRSYLPKSHWSWIHFACTSEDINNLAYGYMIRDGRSVLAEQNQKILDQIRAQAQDWKSQPLLCRTHGQTATPSTMGKEWAVFWYRAQTITQNIIQTPIPGKINGATGTFSAHSVAFPNADWIDLSRKFVEEKLKLYPSPLTTQIESHDQTAALLHGMSRLASVYIDLCRDIWGYVSLGYFGQKTIAGEVGSSTMPHKVNPIDFENAEGNFKIGRGLAHTLADELPVSRWQRDLTDSTLQRNLGLVFGHVFLGLKSLEKGLGKLQIRPDVLQTDLKKSPEVLTEAIQTVLRAHGHHDAYEQLKNFSRGQALNQDQILEFVDQTDLPSAVKSQLKKLTPQTYTGLSEALVDRFLGGS